MNHYFAKYQAYKILKQSEELDKLTLSLSSSKIDFNPHQIYAALFAIKSPFSKGVLLADEVGLGKTIEAALILKQYFCIGKRNLLVICPASLRKQWQIELEDKFSLESNILSNKKESIEKNTLNICSYQFAYNNYAKLQKLNIDLCVLDEAHKLKNLHQEKKIPTQLSEILRDTNKILLTATPLQNSIQELYSLSTFIDMDIFGSLVSFKKKYGDNNNLEDLKIRIKPFTHRILRSDVKDIKYTNRTSNTINYTPSKEEEYLYKLVNNFLMEDNPYSISTKSKHLMNLLIRKFLGSSTAALLSTFSTIKKRLEEKLANQESNHRFSIENDIAFDNEYSIDNEEDDTNNEENFFQPLTEENKKDIQGELQKINLILKIAQQINVDTKTVELGKTLKKGFKKTLELGGQKKCVIFTESVKTQVYLSKWFRSETTYKVTTFNGHNNDDYSKDIYNKWLSQNANTSKTTHNTKVDIRQAIIDDFKNNSDILITTEAGAEGINLQFCSLVVNYDLPWNPQRVEQRIGRCHRYGQKHDVVVINLINTKNTVEQKIYDILNEKFNLFEGMFGASDEILGSLIDGVEFEKTITTILTTCRSTNEIDKHFEQLQLDYKEEIDNNMVKAKKDLFNNFDAEVITTFKNIEDELKDKIQKQEEDFWNLTKYIIPLMHSPYEKYYFNDNLKIFGQEPYEVANNQRLPNANASFAYALTTNKAVEDYAIKIKTNPHLKKIKQTPYNLSTKKGKEVLDFAKNLETKNAFLQFNYSIYKQKELPISAFEEPNYKQGTLHVSLEKLYNYNDVFLIGINNNGTVIPQDILEKLFLLPSKLIKEDIHIISNSILIEEYENHKKTFEDKTNDKVSNIIKEEQSKIDKWVQDKSLEAEMEKNKLEEEKKELVRQRKNAQAPMEIMRLAKEVNIIEDKISSINHKTAKKQESIKKERDKKMQKLSDFLQQEYESHKLFTITWEIV
ncbi:RNA polymerase-associated protein RapA [Candidatus Hepatincola sp. Pdp]